MNEDLIITVARQTMITVLTLAGPMLVAGLIVGLTVSILQSVTSIHEQSLSMIPKMIAVLVTLVNNQIVGWHLILAGLVVGSAVGALLAVAACSSDAPTSTPEATPVTTTAVPSTVPLPRAVFTIGNAC